jgi:N-acetylmuramoyl-L-alanine amidase
MVVVHHTAMADCDAALARLCDPASEVSCHYLISETGAVWQLVDEEQRSWHAGTGGWGRVRDVNSHSIGIELANPGPTAGFPPYPEAQMSALEALLPGILQRWSIPPERVIAHSDMAPTRKSDPGTKFDWRRLALQGLSVWPGDGLPGKGDFAADAIRFGYATVEPEVLLKAFRLRFRPGLEGPLDDTDRSLLHDLANRFPVDQTIPSP